jgi:arylsulfatase A-like enzyme
LDSKIGMILTQLETDGLADNTVVVFFGDNGQAHVRGKQFCYDSGLHVPLLIRWPASFPAPRQFKPGTVDDQLIAAIDLAATTLAIAGVPKPAGMEGQLFLGDKADPPREYVFGARDRCDETVFRFRTARDPRYRYIRNFTPERPFMQPNDYKQRSYPVWTLLKQLHAEGKLNGIQEFLMAPTMPAEELYDLQTDPFEIHNLAGSAAYQPVLARLRSMLDKWIEETHDRGRTLEPVDLAARKGMKKAGSDPNTNQ